LSSLSASTLQTISNPEIQVTSETTQFLTDLTPTNTQSTSLLTRSNESTSTNTSNLPILDKEKVYTNYLTAQMLTIGLPLLILLLFGIVFTFLRQRKYSK
jgi:ATP-dependent Zn protease